ncbi:MAG: hypothetical protein CMD14_10190 [Flavobacteriales bacterium]|nr:hypothetical protein [Flavobacteriales bacterium]|tara:strand:+ start:565 stop:1437 length:873 start_codon:yes stop_codon:yes gene_type:complete
MKNILIVLIFTTVLFFYLHIIYHLKKSNDLEIYEIITPSKNELEEICNYRQPVIFDYKNDSYNNINLDLIESNYSSFDLNVRNSKSNTSEEELYIPYKIKDLFTVFDNDKDNKYITENNEDFLNETGTVKYLKYNDTLIRPYFMMYSKYDLLSGSKNSRTPLRYNLYYRNYLHVINGSVKIKLAPPNSIKYLNEVKDFDNYEFRTDIDVWDIENNDTLNKVKFLEVNLQKDQLIYIPSYWWYSIEYDSKSLLINYNYHTYMSMISVIPSILLYYLQAQNVKINKYKKYND